MILYHGTNSIAFESIKHEGILPNDRIKKEDQTYPSYIKKGSVYLTTSLMSAINWALWRVDRKKGEPVVLGIDDRDIEGEIKRDENFMTDSNPSGDGRQIRVIGQVIKEFTVIDFDRGILLRQVPYCTLDGMLEFTLAPQFTPRPPAPEHKNKSGVLK